MKTLTDKRINEIFKKLKKEKLPNKTIEVAGSCIYCHCLLETGCETRKGRHDICENDYWETLFKSYSDKNYI